MSEVKRLIGVGGGVFNHHQRRIGGNRLQAVTFFLLDVGQQTHPTGIGDNKIEETFNHVETCHHIGQVLHEILPDLLRRVLGFLAGHLQKGEDDKRQVTFKFLLRGTELHQSAGHFLPI